jgi:hypothetical protein
MSDTITRDGPRWLIYPGILILGPLSWLAHEFGHWAAGEAMGVDMWMTLNKAGPVGVYDNEIQQIIVALAGPAVTIAIAYAAYLFPRGPLSFLAYGVLFFQFMLRLVPSGITIFTDYPNDEGVAGIMLGVGPYVITIAVAAFLFILTWNAARHIRPGWRHNLGAYLACTVVITAMVFSDNLMRSADFRIL